MTLDSDWWKQSSLEQSCKLRNCHLQLTTDKAEQHGQVIRSLQLAEHHLDSALSSVLIPLISGWDHLSVPSTHQDSPELVSRLSVVFQAKLGHRSHLHSMSHAPWHTVNPPYALARSKEAESWEERWGAGVWRMSCRGKRPQNIGWVLCLQ